MEPIDHRSTEMPVCPQCGQARKLGLHISPTTIYDDTTIALHLGVPLAALTRARRAGGLRFTSVGRRVLLLGQNIIDWLEAADGAPVAGKAEPNPPPVATNAPLKQPDWSHNRGLADHCHHLARSAVAALGLEWDQTSPSDLTREIENLRAAANPEKAVPNARC